MGREASVGYGWDAEEDVENAQECVTWGVAAIDRSRQTYANRIERRNRQEEKNNVGLVEDKLICGKGISGELRPRVVRKAEGTKAYASIAAKEATRRRNAFCRSHAGPAYRRVTSRTRAQYGAARSW